MVRAASGRAHTHTHTHTLTHVRTFRGPVSLRIRGNEYHITTCQFKPLTSA